ncbi:MAG TPA: caspase family protein [Coleofasciculaceae cyanobacterium]
MSQIKRRQFLQFAGSALATLGLSQMDIQRAGDRYARVLAQGTPRKLALLVGINTYRDAPLQGCVTDVELQQQLLIHRFGFNPKDILILTDEQATRQGMLNAFEEHLIKQAKPGDVVLYHFSGHGSQIADPDCDFPDCLNSTFVPVDSVLPTSYPTQGGKVPDIMGHTLFLLMDAIQTENVTVVLDSCHSGGGTRGNFRVRSRSGGSQLQPVDAEKAYQQQWLSKLNLSPDTFKQRRRQGVAKGVVIASTKRDQLAADAPFSDFFAGAFTYLLTQYLWQLTSSESYGSAIPNVARSTTRLSFTSQEPEIEFKPGSNYRQSPLYFISKQTPPAEAVITKVEGNQAELWLGGLDPDSLAAFQSGAILSVVDPQSQEQGRVQLESRQGLVGRAKLLDTAQPGAFLQERTRGIPTNLTLKIGLDSSLSNDSNLAKQALSSIPRLEALPLQQQEVQYILGRVTDAYRRQLASTGTNPPEIGSLGLFTPALELIPGSFGAKNEAVGDAVSRLRPKFQSLLAARMVKTTLNTNSSRLNIVASMQPEGGGQVVANAFTIRGSLGQGTSANRPTAVVSSDSQKLPLGTPVQISVTNNETSELYLSVLVIDPSGEISVVFPNQWVTSDEVTLVSAGRTINIPDPNKDSFQLVTQEPKGFAEVLILASRTPLRQALKALRTLAAQSQQDRGPVQLNQPTEVIDNLLDDVNNRSRGTVRNATRSAGTVRNIDTNQLAALSITFEVI